MYTLARQKRQLRDLVYVERYASVVDALIRRKQLAKQKRQEKLMLIAAQNPLGRDLSTELVEEKDVF